jgi:hypothetical protein
MKKMLITAALTLTALALPAAACASAPEGSLTPQSVTACHDFDVFRAHPSAASAEAMMSASLHVTWKYLGGDIWQLYGDWRADGNNGKYVARDEKYVAQDC